MHARLRSAAALLGVLCGAILSAQPTDARRADSLRAFIPNFPLPQHPEELPLMKNGREYATEQWRLGNYAVALQYFAQAYAEDRAAGDQAAMAGDLNQIGLVQWRLNDCSSAMECYTESARLAELCGLDRLLGLTHLNRAIILKNQGALDSAFAHNGAAIATFARIGSPKDLALAYNNQGQIHRSLGRADSATAYYRRSLAICEGLADAEGMSTACFNLSVMADRAGDHDAALAQAWHSLDLARQVHSKVRVGEALLQLSGLHEAAGQADSALAYLKVHKQYIDSLNALDRSQALSLQQARLGAEVKDLRIRNLQSAQALQRTRAWIVLGALLVLVAVGAYAAQRRFAKVRARKRLLEGELSDTRQVLRGKEQQLKAYLLDLSEKTSRIQLLEEELAQRPGNPFPQEDDVAQLLAQKILTDEDWRAFKERFSSIYPHFFARMKLLGIPLTEGEVRSMVLLRLGLAPKEMAELLGISPQSARVGKLRLKKKLAAAGHGPVEDLLERLTA